MADTIRSFIALDLPGNIREQIGQVQDDLKRDGLAARWVKPGNIHLTLHFFGDIAAERIESIRRAMSEAAACAPLHLRARGIGVFPGIRKARVIWVGVDGDRQLLPALQQRLAGALESIGFPTERRTFKAHLTLGRFRTPPNPERVARAVEACQNFSSDPFVVSQLTMFESRLTPAGAIYTKIHEIPLDAGPAGRQPATADRRTR
ncbi:MAG: RNA 2',3'-cyclic phosphodiesterase [Desulfobacterales bacterium]|jgi:2'-5' RNA ligase